MPNTVQESHLIYIIYITIIHNKKKTNMKNNIIY